MAKPEQIVCCEGVAITVAIGFTVMSTVMIVPLQAPMEGVMVYLTTARDLVLFVKVWVMELPLPFEKPLILPLTCPAVQE